MTELEKQKKYVELINLCYCTPEIANEKIELMERLERQEADLPREKAMILAQKIWPVITCSVDSSKLWIEHKKICSESYTWNPIKIKKASDLQKIEEIVTYHKCIVPYISMLSAYQVLYQIRTGVIEKVVAFEILTDSCEYDHCIDRHAVRVVLYSGKLPDLNQVVRW